MLCLVRENCARTSQRCIPRDLQNKQHRSQVSQNRPIGASMPVGVRRCGGACGTCCVDLCYLQYVLVRVSTIKRVAACSDCATTGIYIMTFFVKHKQVRAAQKGSNATRQKSGHFHHLSLPLFGTAKCFFLFCGDQCYQV